MRSNSHLDGTKLRLGVNNLLNTQNIAGVTAGSAAVPGVAYTAAPSDVLSSLTPGRSYTMSVTFGYSPKR